MENINSPITRGYTRKIKDIPIGLIKRNIKKQYSFDISDYCKNLSHISILECEETGFQFYHPSIKIDEENFYNNIGRKESYYPTERWEFNTALDYINPEDNILEIGSGYGYFLDILAKKHKNYQGIELNENAIAVVSQKGHPITNTLIQDFCKINVEKFDVVCFFQVLEHILDVESFMQSVIKTLKKGGKLIIAVPNNDADVIKYDYLISAGNLPPHHAGLWKRNSLINLGKYFGLNISDIKEEPCPKSLVGYYYNLKVRNKLGILAPIIVLSTRWFAKLLLKRKVNKILGPTILIIFEKP